MKKLSKSVSFFTALMLTAWPLHAAPETADFPDSPKAGEAQSILSLHQAEIRDALRLIATEYDLSIVMNDEVTGAVTLRLKNASLVNTLDALLVSRGLDYDIRDNIIRVASAILLQEIQLTLSEAVDLYPPTLASSYQRKAVIP